MNQISDNPGPKDFGHEFNYSAWSPDNEFTLCNVPWDNNYRDVWAFTSHDELNAKIDSLQSPKVTVKNATRAKLSVPLKVGMSLSKAMQYNYVRVRNGLQPVVSGDERQSFYYFIIGIREINPETTELTLQLDVWASFYPLINGVRGYVERGHIGIANTKAFDDYGRAFLTIPEGIDLGSEYRAIAVKRKNVMHLSIGNVNVLGIFATDPTAPPYKQVDVGDGKIVRQPNYTTSRGSKFQGLPSGATVYAWENVERFKDFMNQTRETPWISSGMLSAMIIPDLTRYWQSWDWAGTNIEDPNNPGVIITGKLAPEGPPTMRAHTLFKDWRNNPAIVSAIPERYRGLKKFFTFPYMVIEMTTWNATPIMLKPESWAHPDAAITERANLLPPNARIQFSPQYYNAIPGYQPYSGTVGVDSRYDWDADPGYEDGGEYFDLFTQITNLPTLPIVNDGAILALANQSNSIAFQNQSADWSQQRALTGAQTGYDQTMSGINASRESTLANNQLAAVNQRIGQVTESQNYVNNAMGSMLTGGVGGGALAAMGGGGAAGVVGAMGGAALSGIGAVFGQQALNNSQKAANDQLMNSMNNSNRLNDIETGQTQYVADSNRGLAQYAARGDYENTIAGINAKVRDIGMTPASVVGQMGGELINLINGAMEVSLRWKMIDPAAMRVIGEYWLRYGYAVRQYVTLPVNFQVMDRFTYWKLSESYLSGAYIPEHIKQALRGIIEKGVTVWAKFEDIGDPSYDISDNRPLPNVSLI